MSIRPATDADIPRICALYEEAIDFQRRGGFPSWQSLGAESIRKDLTSGELHVLVLDGLVVGAFCFSRPSRLDLDLWQDPEPVPARYLNRIVVGREWKGHRLFESILIWSESRARQAGIRFLRLVTWQENLPLMHYYEDFGFVFMGARTTAHSEAYAPPYRGLRLSILQKPVNPSHTPNPMDEALANQ
ncbi:GNAT family N-acetyltransferase [Mitsuaria sp. GD03876]|uniref:GNAT family N-acetyltransferase n=1 Tax=Mitsuaria sp. GD03876 TaxID=2975399 RepID=UPI00244A33FC|nr:GNAT family N-acetyltransferase [Mitsuaria sp. GD03876]MDH0863475.1 GNAT family N-acetyltransferase [Mitsuaria sp. GD03876]